MSSNKSQLNSNYQQGKYQLKNANKYIGDPQNIVYRSSWELAFCNYLDVNKSIIKWSCEQPIVVYQDMTSMEHGVPKTRRYYVDFFYEKLIDGDECSEKVMVEIKPSTEVKPPVRPLNETTKALKNYSYGIKTYAKNCCKWEAAERYAKKRGYQFLIITEVHLMKAGLIPAKSKYRKNKR